MSEARAASDVTIDVTISARRIGRSFMMRRDRRDPLAPLARKPNPFPSCFGRQPCGLPGQDAARQMSIVGKALLLCRQRGRDRAPPGAAGKDHLTALRIRDRAGVEARQRQHPASGGAPTDRPPARRPARGLCEAARPPSKIGVTGSPPLRPWPPLFCCGRAKQRRTAGSSGRSICRPPAGRGAPNTVRLGRPAGRHRQALMRHGQRSSATTVPALVAPLSFPPRLPGEIALHARLSVSRSWVPHLARSFRGGVPAMSVVGTRPVPLFRDRRRRRPGELHVTLALPDAGCP